MKIQSLESHRQDQVQTEGASGARMRMLIGPSDAAPNFHMRQFEVAPGGHTPHHHHDYEHEILVLSGTGIARSAQGDRPLQAGDVVFVPPDEEHQFRNTGANQLSFICVIPAPKDCAV